MIIILDDEGKKALTTVADLALKAGGIQVLSLINTINSAVTDYKEPEDGEGTPASV